jgi:N-acetylmuramoyl-L-alanine amidase
MWQVFRAGLVALGVISGLPALADTLVVTGARIGDQGGGVTRVVLDLSAPAPFEVHLVADPYRAVIDLPEVEWRMSHGLPARGLVTGLRFGQVKQGSSRAVIDLAGPAAVAKSFPLPPHGEAGHRIVIDLKPSTREAFLAAARAGDPMAAARSPQVAAPPAPPRRPPKRVVAIDAGHGGVDPGAVGAEGTFEKEVTLAQAGVLRRSLIATGRYEVVLIRDDDSFVALRERIRRAHAGGAEVFISLHADTLNDRTVRGGTVYTLSENASDAEAAALAARENRADALAGVDLKDHSPQVAQILIELTQRVTMNASAVLARELVHELSSVISLMHNTHRFAGFAVLKSPEIPSVLVEMGYLSNRQDERQLKDPQFRARLAAALVKGLDRYFASQQALKRP